MKAHVKAQLFFSKLMLTPSSVVLSRMSTYYLSWGRQLIVQDLLASYCLAYSEAHEGLIDSTKKWKIQIGNRRGRI